MTPILHEGSSCGADEVSRFKDELDVAGGTSTGNFSLFTQVRFPPTNGEPFDRCEIIFPSASIVNGTQF